MAKSEDSLPEGYGLTACAGSDLSLGALAECLLIIKDGGAVNFDRAKEELPLAPVVAIVSKGNQIVGVGAIKQSRPRYASSVAKQSGQSFDKKMLELGYVAVDKENRSKHLSSKIVDKLISEGEGQLFATTDCEQMKSSLKRIGFKKRGKEWAGKRGQLSLWIKQ
jgi:hypothetical protein